MQMNSIKMNSLIQALYILWFLRLLQSSNIIFVITKISNLYMEECIIA
jgi:hypothetical protein